MKHIVYLVDDDEDDCFLAQQALSPQADCEFKTFCNGHDLIRHLTDYHWQPLPTLILLDLNMPLLNGFETLSALKKQPNWTDIPVVILTTSDSPQDRARCFALGADSFLTKPADYRSLNDVLASVSTCWRNA